VAEQDTPQIFQPGSGNEKRREGRGGPGTKKRRAPRHGISVGMSLRAKSDINVTPLVDVVLVLLIIFMVITPIVQMAYDVDVPPKAPPDVKIDEQTLARQVVVSITADGEIFINKDPVQPSLFSTRISDVVRTSRVKVVFFSCDEKYNYGEAMKIMDAIKNCGTAEGKEEAQKIGVGIVLQPVMPAAGDAS
jgi:biopolymer transport protein TolR